MPEERVKVQDLDIAERIYRDGYYDDGAGTSFALPAVVAVCPNPKDPNGASCRVVFQGGAVFQLEEDPVEMAHAFRAWGVARREAARVFGTPPEDRSDLPSSMGGTA